jgi:signal transduction histidine kinase
MQRNLPGREVINVFRFFVGIRLVVAVLTALAVLFRPIPRLLPFETSTAITLVEVVLLFIYLSLPWLQRRLGAWYLPVGLAVATLGPVLENWFLTRNVWMVSSQPGLIPAAFAQEISRQVMLAGQFQLAIMLLVPLILVSWLYSWRVTAGYVLALLIFDFVVVFLLNQADGLVMYHATVVVIMRTLVFLFFGYLINRLVADQKRQNAELAEANRRLAHFATTLEQLGISRERNRLAREFHDTLAHTLSAVAVQLEAASALKQSNPARADEMLDHSLAMTRDGLNETRRAIKALRAAPLEDLGLRMALESLARTASERYSWDLHLDLPDQVSGLSPEAEHSLYRIVEEALRNTGEHAQARRVDLSLRRLDGRMELTVQDDGRGFDEQAEAAGEHYGLRGMNERAAEIGATLAIDSYPGRGTRLSLMLEGQA